MIKNINMCQNVQMPHNLAFRAKQESGTVTPPMENISMKGADALASYNSVLVQEKDSFDVPLLKPLELPKDINSVQGERVYNSKGVLQCVVKDAGDKKYVYSVVDDSACLEIYDKKTGNKIFEQDEYEYTEANINDSANEEKHTCCWIAEYDAATGIKTAQTRYEDGVPKFKELEIINPDDSYEYRGYNYNNAEYEYSYYDANGSSVYKVYDVNKNLKSVYKYELQNDGNIEKEIKYENGKEVLNKTHVVKASENPELSKYLQDPELKPAECPEFITKIDDIQGEKTYYSNGQLESVRTADGKVYEISLDGHCITLYDKNKKTEFAVDPSWGKKYCTIIENFGEDEKETRYGGKDGKELDCVSYIKGNIEKYISYEHNRPFSYSERDNSKDWSEGMIIDIDFAQNGGILDVRRKGDYQ